MPDDDWQGDEEEDAAPATWDDVGRLLRTDWRAVARLLLLVAVAAGSLWLAFRGW